MNTVPTRPRNVHIYLESNPNPNSLKFVASYMLVPEGESYDFPDAASAKHAPLAQELFGFEHVARVFYMSNFVTVTKDEQVEWAEIQEPIKQHIKQYLEAEKPLLVPEAFSDEDTGQEDSEVVVKIKSILNEYIRPAVEQDGGAISFHSFQEGTVTVLLQGACSGCPSSTITLKAGIENLLKTMVPEVRSVIAEGI